jgi:AraC-like DNA-binding protein
VPKKDSTNPVVKALWFIESHSGDRDITLDDIAEVSGVSRYHLSRAFGLAIGHPVMQYLRARRLTEAARVLAAGAPDILAVALDAGYGSHEAFTRAFRDQFGETPENVRAQGNLAKIDLTEAITMNETERFHVEQLRFESGKTMLLAGLSERCGPKMNPPALWQRFAPHIGNIPGQVGSTAYGVICNSDDLRLEWNLAEFIEEERAAASKLNARRSLTAPVNEPGHVTEEIRSRATRQGWSAVHLDQRLARPWAALVNRAGNPFPTGSALDVAERFGFLDFFAQVVTLRVPVGG